MLGTLHPQAVITFGPFEADLRSRELRKNGVRLRLPNQSFQILSMLLERPGQLVGREELHKGLWPSDTFVDFEKGINAAVKRLREALGDSPDNPKLIETLPKRGYRFIGTLSQPPAGLSQVTNKPDHAGRAHERDWLRVSAWIAAVVVFAALPAASCFLFRHSSTLTDKDTIVLADFTNSTGDPVFDATLRQGLQVELEQSPFLSLVSDVQIQQILRLMGQPQNARLMPEIARDLCTRVGSKAYIAGSIANLGRDYVIGLQAVTCATGDSLAQEQVQALGKEKVLDGLGQAAVRLRKKLGESLSSVKKFSTPLVQVTTSSLEALQALTLGKKELNDGDNTASVLAFQRAIALDPNFAAAYASLASSYNNLGESSLAIENLKKAYELRGNVSEREKFSLETSYAWLVTGDLEKAREVYELLVQTYPRDASALFNLGNIYDGLGQYEKGLAAARKSLRLEPASPIDYGYLVYSYLILNRLAEAQAAAKEALAKYPDFPDLHTELYALAFLQNDSAEMAQQVAWTAGKKGLEDVLLGLDADTSAYFGQLAKAREQSRRAVASAEDAKEKETAASHRANAALREALFGNPSEARRLAAAALQRSPARDVQYAAALALAMVADSAKSQSLADNLARLYPEDTLVRLNYLPTLRAQLALNHKDGARAIQALQVASPYELATSANPALSLEMYPVFVRGQAYLETHQGREAAAEFQKVLDHRGLILSAPIGVLAHLGLARALALQGDVAKARSAYQDFITLWKNADPNISILQQATTEFAALS